jgi:hypothetical protein
MSQATTQIQLYVSWGKCTGDRWCELNTVDLSHEAFSSGGVYLIWHGGTKPHAVYVGQGTFRDRLLDHRKDPRIQAYSKYGLYVAWALVDASKRDGVEIFLANQYSPLVGDRHPDAKPITVNLP